MDHLEQIKKWQRPKTIDTKHTKSFIYQTDYPEYTQWCKDNKIPKSKKIMTKYLMSKVGTSFFDEVAHQLVESKGGVSLRRFGYFFIHRIPRKLRYKRLIAGEKINITYNHHTDHTIYAPVFVPKRSKALSIWSMDGKFSRVLKVRLNKNLRSGYRYQSHLATIKQIL